MLSERDQCQAIELLSRISCAAYGALQLKRVRPSGPFAARCNLCDADTYPKVKQRAAYPESVQDSQAIFSKLIRLPCFVQSGRQRLVAMVALRRLVVHTVDADFLDIESSSPGQWCIQSLQSSIRELRIAAG
jgi:serine/threonine-protein kinase ATR